MPSTLIALRALHAPLAVAALAGFAACGPSQTQVTVGANTLIVMDTPFGATGTNPKLPPANATTFCSPLDNVGQYEIFLSSTPVCTSAQKGAKNGTVFHTIEETNLRLIIPSTFLKNPNGTFKQNDFKVAKTGNCSSAGGGAAAAFFSHNPMGSATYDEAVEASSGTISVTNFTGTSGLATGGQLTGTYDLTFAGQEVTGSFNSYGCPQIPFDYGT